MRPPQEFVQSRDTAWRLKCLTVFKVGLVMSVSLTGCVAGAQAKITNNCDHPVDALIEEVPSQSVHRDFDPENLRESVHVKSYAKGGTAQIGLRPSNSAKTVSVIVYGADTAKVDYFGDQLTGSLEYVITGDMCLTPAEGPAS